MLIIHIVSATIGILGAYLGGILDIRGRIGRARMIGIVAAWGGLLGTAVSGVFLFYNDPETFLASGKFLSNMTIIGFLIVAELVAARAQGGARHAARGIAMFSWTWIFAAALLNPPYPYAYFMIAYSLVAGTIILILRRHI